MSRKTKALEFAQEGYTINITGRNVLVTDAMKDYAMDKVSKIERFTSRIIEVLVIMDIQRQDHRVEIIIKSGNMKIVGSAITSDMYLSIDKAVERIKDQLLRYKDKIQDHHAKGLPVIDMNVNVLRRPLEEEVNEEIEDESRRQLEKKYRPHRIVGTESKPLKILTHDEAIMKMELSGDSFLVFIHEDDRKLKVIYRRTDGDYGIMEPQK